MKKTVRHLFANATSQTFRSTVVKSLQYTFYISIAACIFCFLVKVHVVGYFCMVICAISFIAYLFAYFYCLLNRPDDLRSEKFKIIQSAMETYAKSGDSMNNTKVTFGPSDFIQLGGQNNDVQKLDYKEEEGK